MKRPSTDPDVARYVQHLVLTWLRVQNRTQGALAKAMGVSPAHITALKSGRNVGGPTIEKLAKVLHKTPGDLWNEAQVWALKNPAPRVNGTPLQVPKDSLPERGTAIARARANLEAAIERAAMREHYTETGKRRASADDWYEIIKGQMRDVEMGRVGPEGPAPVAPLELDRAPWGKRSK
jgi:transcriptional regulator with XRE-family HTH domain